MARLKDGTKVVVKVQHHRVLELMMDDLSSLWTIVRFVAWAEPQYDFTTVIEELVKHVKLELDFHFEVENLQRAGKVRRIRSGGCVLGRAKGRPGSWRCTDARHCSVKADQGIGGETTGGVKQETDSGGGILKGEDAPPPLPPPHSFLHRRKV